MANHINKSPTCHAKFQTLMTLLHHGASQSATGDLLMDTGGDESTEMELDIQPPTPTDIDQLDVGATSDADDPPPDVVVDSASSIHRIGESEVYIQQVQLGIYVTIS